MFIGRRPAPRAFRAVSSEMRSRIASSAKLATSDEPPYDTNGKRDAGERDHARDAADDEERLEAEDRRDAGREELRERAGRVDRDPVARCPTSSMNAMSTPSVPTRPSSSPIAAKTKSVAAFGMRSGLPRPSPVPATPPDPNAYHDWMIWKPSPCAVGPRVEPGVDAHPDVPERVVREHGADRRAA